MNPVLTASLLLVLAYALFFAGAPVLLFGSVAVLGAVWLSPLLVRDEEEEDK